MTAKNAILFLLLPMCQLIFAQRDTIVPIREVSVSDALLKKFSQTLSVVALNDSVIEKNGASLTSLLNYNSNIYFKENGLGMVSSPSFRGTTAQQTAVIWNGININSQLTGQTDFNTITTGNFDNIAIRAGGGSAIYGSSAIGGSVHLNNELPFTKQFTNEFRLGYGSFETYNVDYNSKASTDKASINAGISRNSSANDYRFIDTKSQYNQNGQFYNTSVNADFGYKINNVHFVKFYSQVFEGERHFSGTIASKSKSKYQDLNSRNLLEWDAFSGKIESKFKVAFLSEQYKYFEDANASIFETAKAETAVAKYDFGYHFNPGISADLVVDYTQTKGFGKQIGDHLRNIGSAAFLFKQRLSKKIDYELSVRQEVTNNYKSPFLFAVGTHFQLLRNYAVLFNASRNFRIPDFNDLYWQHLGNPNLKPENSYQAEIGQQLKFSNFLVSATAYYMDITDLIQWSPDHKGNFRPANVASVKSYGAELMLGWHRKIGSHVFDFKTNYAYTVSEDQAAKTQLTYVPVNKANTSMAYSYRKLAVSYQYLFNGQVFTLSEKYPTVKSYEVSNARIDYDFGKANSYKLGFEARNFFNENYQSILFRPMPGRNYSIFLTLKF